MSSPDERHEAYKNRPRSWSQMSSYEQCPTAFYRERIERVWSRPAAWFATGLGVHSAVEAMEKGEVATEAEALAVAQDAFRQDVNNRLEDTPNPEYWFSSGRYHGPEDIPRRFNDLGNHLSRYRDMVECGHVGEIWRPHPDDAPAVEWPIELDLDGVKVIGSADQVRRRDGKLEAVDVKAGSMVPEDPGQLATYAEAIRRESGEEVTEGAYLMTAKKTLRTQIVRKDLTTIPLETLTARFHAADEGIKAGNWDPKPGKHCERCSVNYGCPFRQA